MTQNHGQREAVVTRRWRRWYMWKGVVVMSPSIRPIWIHISVMRSLAFLISMMIVKYQYGEYCHRVCSLFWCHECLKCGCWWQLSCFLYWVFVWREWNLWKEKICFPLEKERKVHLEKPRKAYTTVSFQLFWAKMTSLCVLCIWKTVCQIFYFLWKLVFEGNAFMGELMYFFGIKFMFKKKFRVDPEKGLLALLFGRMWK